MRRLSLCGALVSALMVSIFGSLSVQAQTSMWVQIEAQPTLREAEARARAYAGAFDDVAGFRLASGWYAIALGPYDDENAALRLGLLRAERLVPGDSFVADGRNFRQQFWPVAGALPAPPASAEPVVEATVPEPPPAEAIADPQLVEPQAGLPDETLPEARQSEAVLSRAAREELQSALQWFGFYNAAIDGAFGPGTRAAMQAWQDFSGHEANGVLTTAQRAQLVGQWQSALAELGLETVREAEAGIEIDLPLGMVAFDRYEPPFVHFAPQGDSGVTVLLISQPGDQSSLFGLYDLLQTLDIMPMEGPRERRARSFEISGRNGRLETYAYAEFSGGLIKGYILSWRPADGDRMQRVLAAMKTSFRGFGDRALDPGLVPIDPDQKAGLLSGLEVRRPIRTRSGVWLDAEGTVLTVTEAVNGCGRVTIDGGKPADITYSDTDLGIAILRPRAALVPAQFARVAQSLPRPSGEVAIAGFSFEGALDLPTLTFGRFEASGGLNGEAGVARLGISALAGDAGGPVLDQAGSLIGVLLPRVVAAGRILPDDVAFMVPVTEFTAALQSAGLNVAAQNRNGAMPPEDLTVLGRGVAVQVACWN